MWKTTFKILKMDCPSEEQLIRMTLASHTEVKRLQFDLPNRVLVIFHEGETATIERSLAQLNLDATLQLSEEAEEIEEVLSGDDDMNDKRLLWIVFAINAGFFLIEIVAGFIANSMGLVADSLDMLADAIVYSMSLMVIGSTMAKKKRIANLSGYFQLALAIFGISEVIRRFIGFDATPDYLSMVFISLFALIGNATSLYLLQRRKSKEVHMEASYIFTSNDVIANIGVILAGIIVHLTKSAYPDLLIGTIVFLLVAKGALRILTLSKK